MAQRICRSVIFSLFLLFTLSIYSSGNNNVLSIQQKSHHQSLISKPGVQVVLLFRRLSDKTTKHDSNDPPTIITIPAASPDIVPVTYPGTQPVTNPVTTNPPQTAGKTWCVARSGVVEAALQSGLDYACGIGGADCSRIQQGSSCYDPNTLENHASYAFNSYFQKSPVASSCDFGGTAVLVNTDPSTASCIYPSDAGTSVPSSTPATTTSSSGGTGTQPSYSSPPLLYNSSTGSSNIYGSEFPPLILAPPSQSSSNVRSSFAILALMNSLAIGALLQV